MKYDIRQAAQALVSQLKAIDYERLPISKYNKRYIARLKPVLSYYMKIYANCLLKGLESIGSSPEGITLIDYGGGSGFLSMLAKQAGIGRVIYIDLTSSMLGFGESEQALMIALYIAMDSFGTACNVTGDGAIALIIDKFFGKKNLRSIQ